MKWLVVLIALVMPSVVQAQCQDTKMDGHRVLLEEFGGKPRRAVLNFSAPEKLCAALPGTEPGYYTVRWDDHRRTCDVRASCRNAVLSVEYDVEIIGTQIQGWRYRFDADKTVPTKGWYFTSSKRDCRLAPQYEIAMTAVGKSRKAVVSLKPDGAFDLCSAVPYYYSRKRTGATCTLKLVCRLEGNDVDYSIEVRNDRVTGTFTVMNPGGNESTSIGQKRADGST